MDNFVETIERFTPIKGRLTWEPRGILLSEGFAVCSFCDLFEIDLLIESGIYNGRSTKIWAEYLQDKKVIAIDKNILPSTRSSLSTYNNLDMMEGDANRLVLLAINQNKEKRIGVFIDGPKGIKAINLARKIMRSNNVYFVGIHDMCKNNKSNCTVKSEAREEMERESNYKAFFTDEEDFVHRYSYLDDLEINSFDQEQNLSWEPFFIKRDGKIIDLGSYGPTIGFFYKGDIDVTN